MPKTYRRRMVRKNRRTRRLPKVSSPLKLAITKAIRRAAPEEVKFATSWNSQSATADTYGVWFNSNITGATNYNLVPTIPQGVNVGERSGNKISVRSHVVDFWVTCANLANNIDMVARLFVLQSRNIKDPAEVIAGNVDMSTMLDWGQAQGAFLGYTSHLSAPVNKEQFTVLMDRKLTMDKTYGYNPALINAYSSSAQGQSQGLIHHFRIKLKTPKTLHYASGLNNLPDGYAPFFNAGYCVPSRINADGVDNLTTALSIYWTSTIYYTDA